MLPSSDATPAYRGYRLQALYTLDRILSQKNGLLIFQPEGIEDLAIFDDEDRLLEVVQVKQRTSNLTLSSFKPEKPNSFFYRVSSELDKDPRVRVTIVAFGTVGPEINNAINNNGSDRTSVAKKIASYGFLTESKAADVLERATLVFAAEDVLMAAVHKALLESLAGVDATAAFELLTHWLYICAEKRTQISRTDVIDRINKVGEFVAARAAHQLEWFTSVIPLTDNLSDVAEFRQQLADEFYQGISARYEHILAGLDVVRAEKLAAISVAFDENRVVIVHAASGQGKTTLAFRYLRDFFPAEWRFRVASLSSREQVLRVALAITKHADAIGIPLAVYVDVTPRDTEWTDLVRELANHPSIRVLVTIREEDWRRANVSGAEFSFTTIDLEFNRSEAEQLYESLTSKVTPANVLNFEEAWAKFGEQGPLMEFIYLVTQGTSLRDRLKQQVVNLENDVREGRLGVAEMELLRLVSAASAFEARLQLVPLIAHLDLPVPEATLRLFEREYLLRVSNKGALVDGLHPIRSTILSALLSDLALSPWSQSSAACLEFIHEQDVETFLLYSFFRRRDELEPLLEKLTTYQPKTWTAITGCIRSQIWLGVADYLRANENLIKEAAGGVGQGWAHFLDFDLTDSSDNVAKSWWRDLDIIPEEGKRLIEDLQSRQTDKHEIFRRVTTWLSARDQSPEIPVDENDWQAAAEAIFWLKHLRVEWPLQSWLPETELDSTVQSLSLEPLATLVFSLVMSEQYSDWITKSLPACLDRFKRQMLSVKFEDDGSKVTTHFVFDLDELNEPLSDSSTKKINASENRFHWEALRRVELLRKLLPEREEFGSQGYGHLLWEGFLDVDESTKAVARRYLPIRWLTSVNALLGGLGNQQFRPKSWQDYGELLVNLRERVLESLKQLERGLDVYFRRAALTEILTHYIDTDAWDSCKSMLNNSPLLPASAVDEWGFVSEASSRESAQEESERRMLVGRNGIALQKYQSYLKAFNEHTRTLSNFFSQAVNGIAIQSLIGRGGDRDKVLALAKENGINPNSARLATLNLAEHLKNLSRFQSKVRPLLTSFYKLDDLEKLDRQEREKVWRIWAMWFEFANHPTRVIQNAPSVCTQEATNALRRIRQNLRDRLKGKSSDQLKISIVSESLTWDDRPALWITVDAFFPWAVYEAFGVIINELKQAVQTVNQELRRYILDLFWPYLVVIPLTRGKCITPVAWRVSVPVILQTDESAGLKWWNFAQHNIPTEPFERLKLSTWDLPELAPGQKLLQSTALLFSLAAHIRDFRRLDEIEDEGLALLQEYIHRLNTKLSESLQGALDAETELALAINSLEPSQLQDRPALIEMAETLPRLHEVIMPCADFDSQQTLTLEKLIEWADRLEQAPQLALLCSLAWTADVLERREN
ncbi:MAG TPA: hypothetical protein VJU86_14080 [Pyrinomonadaceae bacterium]|nr:hypothetical protein [Pyrinomonadaceae bacterium]